MKPAQLIGQALAPGGTELQLMRRDTEFVILANGRNLMSSRVHGSEEALATYGCRALGTMKQPRILIGGLGMGYTLRATLDLLPPDGQAIVRELVPAIVEWNRGPLGRLAGYPLGDERVRVEVGDVGDLIRSSSGGFDAVLLDVDNGPAAFAASGNRRLYDEPGLFRTRRALRSGGVLGVWSAEPDRAFERRLHRVGFRVDVKQARGGVGKRGPRHTIYLGHRDTGPRERT